MNLFKVWFFTIINPDKAFNVLLNKPKPFWGLYAILIRFITTSLTSIFILFIMDKKPFQPSYLTFLSNENYYKYEIIFLPIFGLAVWLLSGNLIHLILKIFKKESDNDWILNVIGWGLLTVMPFVWILDWTCMFLNYYNLIVAATIHSIISLWEIILFAIGFNKIKGLKIFPSFILGLIVKCGVYIPLAIIFIR